MPKEAVTINAQGVVLTAPLLAHIATMLEQHSHVKVVNVKKAPSTAGTSAFQLGLFLQEALQAKAEGKF